MNIKETIINEYKKTLFVRQDDNGNVFYFTKDNFKGLNSKELTIKSYKGHKLFGCFYYYDNFIKNKIVIFEHGMGVGHKAYMKEVEKLASHGYLVFAYDHTGSDKSQGDGVGGFAQPLADLDDVLKYLKSLKELKGYTYSIVGHSMGGYSTLNIVNLHDDISHLVSISGLASIKQMHKQIFSGVKGIFRSIVYNVEKENNPNYVDFDSVSGLKKFNGKVLIMHSKDDKVALAKYHYNYLYKHLKNKENIKFILCENKNHNPNYTVDALTYKDEFFEIYKGKLKENSLNTIKEKEDFKASFDWERMTKQDDEIWNVIFEFLDN